MESVVSLDLKSPMNPINPKITVNDSELTELEMYKKRTYKALLIIIGIILTATLNSIILFLCLDMSRSHGELSIILVKEAFNFLLLLIIVAAIIFHPYPAADWGFRKADKRLVFGVGLPVGLLLGAILIAYRIHLVKQGETSLGLYLQPINFFMLLVYYPFVVVVQEATVRGLVQSCFVSLLPSSHFGKFVAILFSSLIFAQNHVVYGIVPTVITFFMSIFLGYLYEKDRSILTVSIIHLCMGWASFGLSNAFIPSLK